MVFPTLLFVLFLAVVLTLNAALARGSATLRKAVLTLASYIFYAAWDWRFCFLMAGVSAIAWAAGLGVRHPRYGALVRIAALTALLATLAVFKYFGFFFLSLQQLLSDTALMRDLTWMRVVLPVGISFYTFQAISYVMDVQRGDVAARRSPLDVALYISFFPQLVAGPIVRAADFLPQLDTPGVVTRAMRGTAILLILTGLFKKMVVANYLSTLLVDPVFGFPDGAGALAATLATLGYGLQIYCDFSGYSDIAIGVALLLGYRFVRNFDQPYRARGLADFWRRWHISLSTWIRDYLYIPLGGSRGAPTRVALTLIVTMTLAGLWHGAGWNFLAWGFLHGAALATERALRPHAPRVLAPLGWAVAMVVVFALWIPFRAPDWATTQAMLAAFGRADALVPLAVTPQIAALLAIGLAMNWLPLRWRDGAETALQRVPAAAQAAILATGTLLLFAVAQDGVAPFIYFQF